MTRLRELLGKGAWDSTEMIEIIRALPALLDALDAAKAMRDEQFTPRETKDIRTVQAFDAALKRLEEKL